MIDWEGNMVEPRDRQQILLSEVRVDDRYKASSVQVSNAENERIDQKFEQLTLNERVDSVYDGSPRGCNELASLVLRFHRHCMIKHYMNTLLDDDDARHKRRRLSRTRQRLVLPQRRSDVNRLVRMTISLVPRNRISTMKMRVKMCVLWVRRHPNARRKLVLGVATKTRIFMGKTDILNEPMKNKEANLNEPMKNQ